jgi:hypothetical protein
MRRRNEIGGESAKKSIEAHAVFVVILTLGAFFRIASEEGIDRNTIIFATILAIGVIVALSLFNNFVIDLCNDLNNKWLILNYFVPGILIGLIVVALQIPIDLFDVFLIVLVMSIANIAMYTTTKES